MATEKKFKDYKDEAEVWITLATGEYYPDILPDACRLYEPVLIEFGLLLKASHSSTNFFSSIIGNFFWRDFASFSAGVVLPSPVHGLQPSACRFAKDFSRWTRCRTASLVIPKNFAASRRDRTLQTILSDVWGLLGLVLFRTLRAVSLSSRS